MPHPAREKDDDCTTDRTSGASLSGALPRHAGAEDEIEVTPEMIEVGLAVLEESGRLTNDRLESGDGLLVQDIFSAMHHHRPAVLLG